MTTPFGYDHSTGPRLSELWSQAAADSAAGRPAEPSRELCGYVLGTSEPDGPGFVNGRPGEVRPDGRREWLCGWPATRVNPDGVPVCGTHAPLGRSGGSLPRDGGSGR